MSKPALTDLEPVNLNALKLLNIFYCNNNTYMNFNLTEVKKYFKGSMTTLLKRLETLNSIGAINENKLSKFPFTNNYSITRYGISIHQSMLKIMKKDYIPGDKEK